jgi:putative ATP-dependent endonuclease of the OLD family
VLGLDGIVTIKKPEGATFIKQLNKRELVENCIAKGAHRTRTNEDAILPFYAASSTLEIISGLFARKIILVEGLTERLALPIYLSKIGLDVTKEGIAIIPVMGKGNLAKWWRFFSSYEIPTFITFDNDVRNDDDAIKRRDVLKTIGLSDGQITTVIGADDWFINEMFCVFGIDFEDTMRNSFSRYREIEQSKKAELGDSKPIIARSVADSLGYDETQVGWQKYREFAENVRALN